MNPSDNIGLTDFLVIVFKFCKRNFIIVTSITLIGLAIGIFYSSQKQEYYLSEMIGFSNIVDNTALLEILTPLSTLTAEENYDELSSKLGISTEEASQIRLLKFANSKHTKTSHAPSVTDKKLGRLIAVSIETYDRTILPKLENGISKFLNDNAYVKSSEILELQKTRNLIFEISKNIALFDSLNNQSYDINSNVFIQKEINPLNYKEALLDVENLKIKVQILQPFTIISNFYKVNKPANRSRLITIAITLAFFGLSLMIVFLKELNQLARE